MNKYRVIFVPAVEKSVSEAFTVEAETQGEAERIFSAIAHYTLFLHDKGIMRDYSNFGCVEQFIDGEWQEVDAE